MAKTSIVESPISLTGLMEVAFIVALIGSWLGYFGESAWFLDLFSHFRLQYAVACLGGVIFATLQWRRWLRLAFIVTLASQAYAISTVWNTFPAGAEKAADGPTLRIISFNLHSGNTRTDLVLPYLENSGAEVLVLMEVTPAWAAALESLASRYPYHRVEPRPGNFGIAVYSKVPLKEIEVKQYTDYDFPAIVALVEHKDMEMRLTAIHPVPPMSSGNHDIWFTELEKAAAEGAQHSGPALMIGDFNASPWCSAMRMMRGQYGWDFHCATPVIQPTWKVLSPLTLPIDLALTRGGLVVLSREIGPELGSDHRPQVIQIGWSQPEAR